MPEPSVACLEACQGDACRSSVETLIFVDIDGVLNVGVADRRHRAVPFDERTIDRAFKISKRRPTHLPPRLWLDEWHTAEQIVATYSRELGDDEAASYAGFAADHATEFSDVLAARLAGIVRAAGKQRTVVLSSSWRTPQRAAKVRVLEEVVSRHLNEAFTFDARTALGRECSPEDRLRFIGKFIAGHCASGASQHQAAPLRVLVLDDFFVSAMRDWNCGGRAVNSTVDAEQYLRGFAASAAVASVRVIHTYAEWTTPEGISMRIGAGLTKEHMDQAYDFLAAADELPGSPSHQSWVGDSTKLGVGRRPLLTLTMFGVVWCSLMWGVVQLGGVVYAEGTSL